MKRTCLYQTAFIVTFFVLPLSLKAQEEKDFLLKLEGAWKFSIFDNKEWSKPEFDDTNWSTIQVPSAWEDQGFNGYDGYAWYRTSFTVSKEMRNKDLYINLGYINDVDQVYINGRLIGFTGSFPPLFSTAFEARRKYPIPLEYLNVQGKNVIAVRVYNQQMAGGILSGDIGISSGKINPDVSISGLWLFKTGDNKMYKDSGYKDKQWKKIVVPGNWENQGYIDYDGVAWYRKHFQFTEEEAGQKTFLVLGKVYNIFEVYINGVQVGAQGKMPEANEKPKLDDDVNHKKFTSFTIPENLIIPNKDNVIAIKVCNVQHRGGIVDGPVGFVKQANYNRYFKELVENGN